MKSETQLLINPNTYEEVCKMYSEGKKKKIELISKDLIKNIHVCGINVPSKEFGGKHVIRETDQEYFTNAFLKYYYPDAPAHKGYYWVDESEYTGPKGEYDKAAKRVLDAFNKK